MSPIDDLEHKLFEAAAEIPGPVVRTFARAIVRAAVAVFRDLDRRLAAVEEKNRHG
jgi:hypothetical protein